LGSDAHFKRANRLRVERDQSGVIIVTDCLGSPPVLQAGQEGFAEKANQIVPHCLAFCRCGWGRRWYFRTWCMDKT